MNKRDKGGPAFPGPWTNLSDLNQRAPNGEVVGPLQTIPLPGMTLRDYFAAKAMASLMRQDTEAIYDGAVSAQKSASGYVAGVAYEYADAMLAARSA